MRIEINPRSLLNLEKICEVLYKLHPCVLDYLIDMKRSFGNILGEVDLNNLSLEKREFLYNILNREGDEYNCSDDEETKIEVYNYTDDDNEMNSEEFHNLRKYIQLDTDEYIPMKIYVEVEDPVIGRKVKELVEELEITGCLVEYYLNKKELDENAYFAKGYRLTMNEEQRKELDDFLDKEDAIGLEKLLRKEKLYP